MHYPAKPNASYAHTQLARSLEKPGDREAAIALLEKAKSMQGATAEPLMTLGRLYATSGRLAEAKKIIDERKLPKMNTFTHEFPLIQ